MDIISKEKRENPPRIRRPNKKNILLGLGVILLFGHSFIEIEFSFQNFKEAGPRIISFISQAFPPNLDNFPRLLQSTLQTIEIALIGTFFGALISLPISVLAAKNTTPNRYLYSLSRIVIATCRSIPDIVWGLIFLVAIGLGPVPGIMAITVDVLGYCGRFFAEKMEEIESGPAEALKVTGVSMIGVIVGAIIPAASPSMIGATLFSLENAIRSAVILGIVGAGGIGVELYSAMRLLQYDKALTIILIIFCVVILVERICNYIREQII